MEWKYVVILISLVLVVVLIIKETKRKDRRHLSWRLISSVMAVLTLALIALPPSYKKVSKSSHRDFVLLTDGFDKDSLAKFPDPTILSTDEKIANQFTVKRPIVIPSLAYYLAENPDIQRLHILGYGLPDVELSQLKNVQVVYHGNEKPFGIQNVYWSQKIKSGESLSVSGIFSNHTAKPVKLILRGLSSNLDSLVIKPDNDAEFKLSSIPKQLGLAIYQLLVISGRDTLAVEKIPFEIEKSKPLKILILSSSPDFETRFLKNWLAENQFSLAIRTSISKEKFSTEFLNMNAISINFQPRVLKDFDLIISDESSLVQLTLTNRAALKNEINKGLGLLIRNEDEINTPGNFGRNFSTLPIPLGKILKIKLPGVDPELSFSATGITSIAPQGADQPLLMENSGLILVNSKLSGMGKIVFSTLNNTYTWKLSGKNQEYSSFWSHVIEKTTRKERANLQIAVAEQFPLINNKNTILVQSNSFEIPGISSGESLIALEQNPIIINQWNGNFWPLSEGWNSVTGKISEKFWWYVYNPSDWKSVIAVQNSKATARFANRQAKNLDSSIVEQKTVEAKVPAIIFYLLFLAFCTYLWIETKFL